MYYKPSPMTEGKRDIIRGLLQKYDIESAGNIQEELKDLPGGTVREMMGAEMNEHLGYGKSERSDNVAYLDIAEVHALNQEPMYVKDWLETIDDYLKMARRDKFRNNEPGDTSAGQREVHAEYESYRKSQADFIVAGRNTIH